LFEVTNQGENAQPVRLASWVLPKFFNWRENPFTMDIDFSNTKQIMVKKDGSLISTFLHNNRLGIKSKTSLFSNQVAQAYALLSKNKSFSDELLDLAHADLTVNMELCGPENRIVIGYPETHLTVLNIRYNKTGRFVNKDELVDYPNVLNHWVDVIDVESTTSFVESVASMHGVEGFVIEYQRGKFVKLKCDEYISLHHAKDSVNNPRRLFECILDEGVDDLRGMFYNDAAAMMTIDQMQVKVDHMFNSMVNEVETFYEMNKHLDRKDYAVKGQAEVSPMYFSRVMNLYLGKSPDYKQFMKSKWKELGIKDMKIEETGE
jgi:T4 RnlA family RNA ligase